jgi:hypothetical protein
LGINKAGFYFTIADAISGQPANAVQFVYIVLETLGGSVRLEQLAPSAERVAAALRQNGFQTEAADVDQRIKLALHPAGLLHQQTGQPVLPQQPQRNKQLPASCPSCGGPLLPNEVKWHDDSTALCSFCGSVIKAI